jgi:hypothetical protein
METFKEYIMLRKDIAIRLLYSIFFIVIFELLKIIVEFIVLFQYIYLFITRSSNEPVRKFGNRVVTYGYHVMRYITLNEDIKPFPFSNFPKDVEPPERE